MTAPAPTDRRVGAAALRHVWDEPAVAEPPRRARSDWFVVAITMLLGGLEALSSGLGWPLVRAAVACAVAGVLLWRRREPLVVLVVTAGITLGIGVALEMAGHYLLISGLMFAVAIYALVRWASGRDIVIGLGVVAVHAVGSWFVNPNAEALSTLIFYGGPVLAAWAVRPRARQQAPQAQGIQDDRAQRSRSIRVGAVAIVLLVMLAATHGVFMTDQIASYVTHTRSPETPQEWLVDAPTLRGAAEASRGTHHVDGAIIHTVDYPHQLLAALESPTFSVEANVTVIDGTAFLQHDPREPVGMPLLEFLEYAAIAEFPIVKLDLKRDRVDLIMHEVRQAIDRFELDPRRVHINANVFRGPGVENDFLGARKDMSSTDSLYNLMVMELEPSDLVHIAKEFPESTIVISATTPSGGQSSEQGYSEDHLARFIRATNKIRAANPGQALVFAVRGDLAAQSGPFFLEGLSSVDDSYVAAWWPSDMTPTPQHLDTLRAGGVTFFDLGQEVGG